MLLATSCLITKHLQHGTMVIQALEKAGLTVNTAKCHLRHTVEYKAGCTSGGQGLNAGRFHDTVNQKAAVALSRLGWLLQVVCTRLPQYSPPLPGERPPAPRRFIGWMAVIGPSEP